MLTTIALALSIFFCLSLPIIFCRKPEQAKPERKASPTPYTGPLYTIHGTQIANNTPRKRSVA